eukprot:COSAG01_NODE_1801_length_9200_cov_13.641358_13_plen_87_part_00
MSAYHDLTVEAIGADRLRRHASAGRRWLTSTACRCRPLLLQSAEQLLRRVRAWLEREGGPATFPDAARAEQEAPDGSYGAPGVFVS